MLLLIQGPFSVLENLLIKVAPGKYVLYSYSVLLLWETRHIAANFNKASVSSNYTKTVVYWQLTMHGELGSPFYFHIETPAHHCWNKPNEARNGVSAIA